MALCKRRQGLTGPVTRAKRAANTVVRCSWPRRPHLHDWGCKKSSSQRCERATGWFRQACIKSGSCYRTKVLLTHRRISKAKLLDLEDAIRPSLKSFVIRLCKVGGRAFEQAVLAAMADESAVGRADGSYADSARLGGNSTAGGTISS